MQSIEKHSTEQTETERATLNLWPEVGKALGLSRGAVYAAANRGEIPVLRFGKRMVVPKAALSRLLNAEAAR